MTGSAYGTREDRRVTYTGNVNLRAGSNRIALLSVAIGLPVGSSLRILINLKVFPLLKYTWILHYWVSLIFVVCRMLGSIMSYGTQVFLVLL